MLYRKSSDETEVTGGYSPSHINASELNERLAQLNERLNNRSKIHIAMTRGIEKTRVIANPPSKLDELAVA